jgi:alcohol dehydrogenase YqhD (iron-dependent ADH family)
MVATDGAGLSYGQVTLGRLRVLRIDVHDHVSKTLANGSALSGRRACGTVPGWTCHMFGHSCAGDYVVR